jgi:hypothetical protein
MKEKTLFKDSDIRIGGSVTLKNGWDAAIEFGILAEAYRESAQATVSALAADDVFSRLISAHQSFRAYPVFFLYRQALELTLKGIILAGADLIALEGEVDQAALYRNHNFERLRPDVEKVFEAIGWGWNFGIPGFQNIKDFRRLLSEFDEFDGTSTVCRYPVNGDGTPSIENGRCVNLFDFAETIDAVLEAMSHVPDTVQTLAEEYMSNLSETAHYESWG